MDEVEDVSGVAAYITEMLFEKEINSTYGEKISKVEYLEGDLYTAYVIKDGKEVPYVTVNAKNRVFSWIIRSSSRNTAVFYIVYNRT